jgi:phosphate transport system substrate-binding protein
MKAKRIQMIVTLSLLCCVACSYADETNNALNPVSGISFENYPKVDGSTSTKPLNALIACKLLNIRYEWESNIVGEWSVKLNEEDIPEDYADFYGERIKVSQTHGAFMNVISGDADIILTHRTLSPDEAAYADELGVTLIETSIALDAFIFLVNKNNPVKNLTVNEVQRIYTGEITNWQQVGGTDLAMKPYIRPRNSGSEEIMQSLVMDNLVMADFPENSEIVTMAGVFPEVRNSTGGICYTFNFYKDVMVRVSDNDVPKVSINGIFPDASTVKNGTYPFISKVHVAIRSDLDRNSMAYKMYEWLQTEAANDIISECGYIPKNTATALSKINAGRLNISPNPVSGGFYVNGFPFPVQLTLINVSGSQVLSKQVSEGEFVNISNLPPGIYFAKAGHQTVKVIKK